MDNDNTGENQQSPTPEDVIKNVKAEFQRKFENITQTNQNLAAQNAELSAKIDLLLSTVNQPNQKNEPEVDLETLRYTDPDKYVDIKLQQTEKRIESKLTAKQQADQAKINTLTQLASKYPELNDPSSALYKEALNIAKNYSKDFMATPEGIKLAVTEAALQVRSQSSNNNVKNEQIDVEGEEDMSEFIGGGSGSGSSKPPEKKGSKLSPKTIAFAELMGLDVKDPKVIKKLEEKANRKDWKRYK